MRILDFLIDERKLENLNFIFFDKILDIFILTVYTVYIQSQKGEFMNIIISNSSGAPIYEQIREQIKNKIVSNELKTGELLPSIRVLAKDLRISVITTKNAYEELEKEGYVQTIPGKGTYVANKNIELIREEQLQKIESLMDTAVSIAKISQISKEDLRNMLEILYGEEK